VIIGARFGDYSELDKVFETIMRASRMGVDICGGEM